MHVTLPVDLYPGQLRGFLARGRELLIGAERRSGASHLLRQIALARACEAPRPGVSVVLAAPDDRTLREQHLEGESGMWQLLRGWPEGLVRWVPGGIAKFDNGSSIQLTTWDRVRRGADLVLLDDADEMELPAFHALRERVLAGPGEGDAPRLVLVAHRPGEGWVREHWARLNGSGGRADLLAEELPARFRGQVSVLARESFGDFISRVLPAFLAYPHVELMIDTAQRVVDGEILRLLVSAPPRYFKSLIWSRLLPAYFLTIRPHEWFSVVCATGKLAETMSSDARDFYRTAGGLFRTDSQDKSLWRTPRGGGMSARGVGGWFMGAGFNGAVFDDPFTVWSEAIKPSVQEFVEDYFWNTFYGRQEISGPPAWIVVNHQALADGDLRGRLLKRERGPEAKRERWTVLNLPAFKRARREPWPDSVTVIPDLVVRVEGGGLREREPGEPLCPTLTGQDAAGLKRLEDMNPLLFAATHQQDPFPDRGGGLFERWYWGLACSREAVAEAWERLKAKELTALLAALMESGAIPVLEWEARAWDYAASLKGEGDASASCRGGVTGRQAYIFTHAAEYYYPASALKGLIFETAHQDGPGVEIVLPQDPAAAGKILATEWAAELEAEGFRAVIVSTSGSKRVRATGHANAASPLRDAKGELDGRMGRCLLLPDVDPSAEAAWNNLFRERHQAFDGVTKPLDLVDATSYLFNELKASTFLSGGMA